MSKFKQTAVSLIIDDTFTNIEEKFKYSYDPVLSIENYIIYCLTYGKFVYDREYKIIKIDLSDLYIHIEKGTKVEFERKIIQRIAPFSCGLVTVDHKHCDKRISIEGIWIPSEDGIKFV